MTNNNNFNWYDYYLLGKSYYNETNIAKLRTGIGRFYYSSFLESRDYILKNKTFLNKINKEIMKSKSGKIHQETRITFKKHPSLNQNNIGQKISQNLNVLRKYRNIVDYDSKNPENLEFIYKKCEHKSEKIFELLKELN